MRYRPLDANGDYTIGVPWLVNSPAAVAQAIATRLRLLLAEWFVDTSDGTAWLPNSSGTQSVLGRQYGGTDPNAPIKQRILGTPGVNSILTYSSSITGRSITVSGTVSTQYGPAAFSVTISPASSQA